MREFILGLIIFVVLLATLACGTTSCSKQEPTKKPVATNLNYLGVVANVYKKESVNIKKLEIKQTEEQEKYLK